MTKNEFIAWIKHRLAGGQPVSSQHRKFHANVIAIAVEQAIGQVFKDVYQKNPSQLDLYAKTFSGITVTYDPIWKTFKADMPSSIVKIPEYEGIRWVVDENYPMENLIPSERQSAMNLNGLFIDRSADVPSYYPLNQEVLFIGFKETDQVLTGAIIQGDYYLVDGDDITYDGAKYNHGEVFLGTTETDFTGTGEVWSFEVIEKISMAVIVPFTGLDGTDEVLIPDGKNQEILQHIFTYFDMPLQDLSNDSKSNPT